MVCPEELVAFSRKPIINLSVMNLCSKEYDYYGYHLHKEQRNGRLRLLSDSKNPLL